MNLCRIIGLSLLCNLFLGCAATLNVRPDGTTDEVVWADIEDIGYYDHKGTFPNITNLTMIKAGMTRDQIYYLIDPPHFTEGFHVRVWQYLFYFNTPNQGTNGITTCQYQILFDTDYIARQFHWRAIDPATATCPPTQEARSITLSSDALFHFNGGDEHALFDAGKQKLATFAKQLMTQSRAAQLTVIGYTDRLGSTAYNQVLSKKRAETVRQYLIKQGLNAQDIRAEGRGERDTVSQCTDRQLRDTLIACLQPDRRVVIEIN